MGRRVRSAIFDEVTFLKLHRVFCVCHCWDKPAVAQIAPPYVSASTIHLPVFYCLGMLKRAWGVFLNRGTAGETAMFSPEGSDMRQTCQWPVVRGQRKRRSASARAAGFTLVELMVVITIIGILSGLGVVAAIRAITTAKNATIKMEMSQLDAALNAFKMKFGEYPPDGLDSTATTAFVRRAFPQYTGSVPTYLTNGNLNPQTALGFWLCGLPDTSNGNVPSGFAADPTNPFRMPSDYAARIKPFMDFNINQFAGTTLGTASMADYRYWPKAAMGNKTSGALVYFRATNGTYTTAATSGHEDSGDTESQKGKVYAAGDSRMTNNPTINNTSYQIFSAGLDTKYGNPGGKLLYPSGDNYNNDSKGYIYDNVTNFTNKSTLENDMP